MILVCSTPVAEVAPEEPPTGPAPFEPFTETNVTFTNKAVPEGTGGVWVTLIGPGANGGLSVVSGTGLRKGGNGGAGGAKVGRVFIPAEDLGPTYTVTYSSGAGVSARFQSGSVALVAGSGTSFSVTGVANCPTAAGGTGGIAASTGSGTSANGGTSAGGGGSGGGGGAGFNSNDNGGLPGTGGAANKSGGAGGNGGNASTTAAGSAGRPGSAPGGGGGGAGAVNNSGNVAAAAVGMGAAGRVILEWVAPAPGTPPPTTGAPHAPETSMFTAAGNWVYHIPEWANRLDVVLLGGGAGGSGGAGANFNGGGGHTRPGQWFGATLSRGSAGFPLAGGDLTGVVGAGSGGGTGHTTNLGAHFWASDGQSTRCDQLGTVAIGGESAKSWPMDGWHLGSQMPGESPGNFMFNGVNYVGGAGVTTAGRAGNAPGGGGAGGSGGLVSGDNGGAGGTGRVWIRAWYSDADAVVTTAPGTGTGGTTEPDALPFFITTFDDPAQPDWRHKAGAAPTIRNSAFCSLTPNSETVAECLHVPDGDDVEVMFQIQALHEGDAAFIRSSDLHTLYVVVTTTGGRSSFDLYTHTAWDIGTPLGSSSIKPRGTKRATYQWGAPPLWGLDGAPAIIRAVGSLYTVTVDGTQIIEWDDTAGVHPVGAAQRKCGLATKSSSPGILTYSIRNL